MKFKNKFFMADASNNRFLSMAGLIVSLLLLPVTVNAAQNILSNGTVTIGVNPHGDLIYRGIGLIYVPTNGESLEPGCWCEGWGVADEISRKYAKAGQAFWYANAVVELFEFDNDVLTSVVRAADIMRVTHRFSESISQNLYQVHVSIENISEADIHLLYRRAMDWDIPPTAFSEMVTIVTNGASDVRYTSDNGFADGNPLVPAGKIAFEGEAYDNGPRDHGAVFDFDFGVLKVGEVKEFVIYYGAAENEEESLAALAQVGAEVYSLAKPNPAHAAVGVDGSPNTFIFGFGGVGGTPVQRPFPDLTLGGLKVVDNGKGQPVGLAARIGNAGHPDTAPVNSAVSFYAGNPKTGGQLLGIVPVQALEPGGFTDVTLEGIDNVQVSEIHAVVDAEKAIQECSETNNSQFIPFNSVTPQGVISVNSSAQTYTQDDIAELTAVVANTGRFGYEFDAVLSIEDSSGNPVHAFLQEDLGLVAGGTTVSVTRSWPVNGVLSGVYRVRGKLLNKSGAILSESVSSFRVNHDYDAAPAATLLTRLDRAVYHTTDTVLIDMVLSNSSAYTLIENAVLELRIADAEGVVISQKVFEGVNLVPGQVQVIKDQHPLLAAAVGEYVVSAALVGTDGFVFASNSADFQIWNDLTRAIRGSASVGRTELFRGEGQVCVFDVENAGTGGVGALELVKRVVHPETEQVKEENTVSIDLAAGERQTLDWSITTAGYDLGAHACVLHAQLPSGQSALGYATFNVLKPPIALSADMLAGTRGRILVVVDPGCDAEGASGNCNADPYGPADAPPLDVQRAHLEAVLEASGWRYTIVDNAEDFETEFRSNAYAVYGIFIEQIKLPEALQRDVVADIAAGRGLLVAGNHDHRNGRLQDALGIKSLGKNLDVETLLTEPFGEHAGGEFEFLIAHHPNALRLEGAEVLGEYRLKPKGNKPPETEPALTRHEHGQGVGIYAGFDWPVQSAVLGDDGELAQLFIHTLDNAHPQPYAPITGRVFPLQLLLQNEGIAIPGEVQLVLPFGTSLHEGPAGSVVENGIARWPFQLAEDEQKIFVIWLRMPETAGAVPLEAVIHAGENDELEEYARSNITLNVQAQ